jgi:hypothetical protein
MIARLDLYRVPLVLAVALAAFNLPVAAAQSFAISAAPATTDSQGAGSIKFTVSGIPFSGQLVVACQYAGSVSYQAQARLPVCGIGPIVAFTVTTGQTVNSAMSLVPWGSPIPLAQHSAPQKVQRGLASGFLFAGVVLLGFGLRRRRRLPPWLLVLAALAIASGLAACGGSSTVPPAGTYPYTMTATLNSTSPAILSAATSTTVNVTVP